jgi:hypothetical protein
MAFNPNSSSKYVTHLYCCVTGVWGFRVVVYLFIFFVHRCVFLASIGRSFHHAAVLVFLFTMKNNSITDQGLAIMKLGDHYGELSSLHA